MDDHPRSNFEDSGLQVVPGQNVRHTASAARSSTAYNANEKIPSYPGDGDYKWDYQSNSTSSNEKKGYGANPYGAQGGYGGDRYGASNGGVGAGAGGGSRYGPGGYGGLGPAPSNSADGDSNRDALVRLGGRPLPRALNLRKGFPRSQCVASLSEVVGGVCKLLFWVASFEPRFRVEVRLLRLDPMTPALPPTIVVLLGPLRLVGVSGIIVVFFLVFAVIVCAMIL